MSPLRFLILKYRCTLSHKRWPSFQLAQTITQNGLRIGLATKVPPKQLDFKDVQFLQFASVQEFQGNAIQKGFVKLENVTGTLFAYLTTDPNKPVWYVDANEENRPFYNQCSFWNQSGSSPNREYSILDAPGPTANSLTTGAYAGGTRATKVVWSFQTFILYKLSPVYCVSWNRTFTFAGKKWTSAYKITGSTETPVLSERVPAGIVTPNILPGYYTVEDKGMLKMPLRIPNLVPKSGRTVP